MKTAILVGAVLLGSFCVNESQAGQRYCRPTAPVVYGQPVVYQAPVVYTAPVMYNAPVYYQGHPAYSQVVYTAPVCQTPNVIISGRGAYYSSWNTSPTVITIGSGHARHGSLPYRRFR